MTAAAAARSDRSGSMSIGLDVHLQSQEGSSSFEALVEKAGLENLFNGKVNVNATVYIPTNEAFETMHDGRIVKSVLKPGL